VANEDIIITIGANAAPFLEETKRIKSLASDSGLRAGQEFQKQFSKAANTNVTKQFAQAAILDLQRIQKEAGQIKFDTIGSKSYFNLAAGIDEAFGINDDARKKELAAFRRNIEERNAIQQQADAD
jgi:hypothetical protein